MPIEFVDESLAGMVLCSAAHVVVVAEPVLGQVLPRLIVLLEPCAKCFQALE
jgi:hypothetical protein